MVPLRFLAASLILLAVPLPAADIGRQIEHILGSNVPSGGEAAVAVLDLEGNRWLVKHHADEPRSLASTTKSLVAAAALTQLGKDFRFHTHVYALFPPRPQPQPGAPAPAQQQPQPCIGLGVVGGGDPTLDVHFYDDQPERVFADWADQLRKQGITAIDGDVVIDGRLFSGPIRPDTYPQDADNLQRWYSAPASAFAWNDNCIEVRVVPTRVGEPAQVQVRPESPRITVTSTAKTVGSKGDRAIFVSRAPDSNSLTVSGNYSQATPWFPVSIHDQPDLLAGDALKAGLEKAGIAVRGTVRLGAVDPRQGRLVIDHSSPLVPALSLMLHNSQNFYGEQLLRLLGFEQSRAGTIEAGSAATLAILKRLAGPAAEGIHIIDGSGLSYGNHATAEAMVGVFAAMHRSPLRDEFYASLKEKNVGKVQGRVKTGTLAVATCLVGYLDPPSGGRLAFAILFNKGTGKNLDWGPRTREEIYRVMASR